jgi:DNA-binding transcriptional ArsR family regulator
MNLNTNRMAEIGALIGDPARAVMLGNLMDGRALTAGELAEVAGVAPSTASGHLARMTEARLLELEKQGRHRYYRIASPEIAHIIESLMQFAAGEAPVRKVVTGPKDAALRRARTCYDHLAGRIGVAIGDSLLRDDLIRFEGDSGLVTEAGIERLGGFGIDVGAVSGRSARPACRPCLDWSERVPHVAGRLGAAICRHYFDRGYLRRQNGGRALDITPPGQAALKRMFGISRLD